MKITVFFLLAFFIFISSSFAQEDASPPSSSTNTSTEKFTNTGFETDTSSWNSGINAIGGAITTIGSDTIHTFSKVGKHIFNPNSSGDVEVLVVGGAGGSLKLPSIKTFDGVAGELDKSIFGGGGGVSHNPTLNVDIKNYAVVVGAAGKYPNNGGMSYFDSLISKGGYSATEISGGESGNGFKGAPYTPNSPICPAYGGGFNEDATKASFGCLTAGRCSCQTQNPQGFLSEISGSKVEYGGGGLGNGNLSDGVIIIRYHGLDESINKDIKYQGDSSVKITNKSIKSLNFTQSVNVGNNDTYILSIYAYIDGITPIDNKSISMIYNDSEVPITYTLYTSIGNGWYKISSMITGVNNMISYGFKIKAGKTLYLDNASLTKDIGGDLINEIKNKTVIDIFNNSGFETDTSSWSNSVATGGTITDVGMDKVHTFINNISNSFTPAISGNVEVLVVAGGGDGGRIGGGGGGVFYRKSYPVIKKTYFVNVGMNGKNSSFDTLIATAGVSGLDGDGSSGTNGGDIDSKKVGPFKGKNAGGGAGGEAVKGTSGIVPDKPTNSYTERGYEWCNGDSAGEGLKFSISGAEQYYGGGGGSRAFGGGGSRALGGCSPSYGGSGVGGTGGGGQKYGEHRVCYSTATSGRPNTGGGGGGADGDRIDCGSGYIDAPGFGGSGIVIVRYSSPKLVIDSTVKYSGNSSVKITTNNSKFDFVQSVNVGNTKKYMLSAYVYIDGTTAVDGSYAQLIYNGSVITTIYTPAVGGWYKLTGEIIGKNKLLEYGIQIKENKTIYVDDFMLEKVSEESESTISSKSYTAPKKLKECSTSDNNDNIAVNTAGSGLICEMNIKKKILNELASGTAKNNLGSNVSTTRSSIPTSTTGGSIVGIIAQLKKNREIVRNNTAIVSKKPSPEEIAEPSRSPEEEREAKELRELAEMPPTERAVEERRHNAKIKYKKQHDDFVKKLELIVDEDKKSILDDINKNLSQMNISKTNQSMKAVMKMSSILESLEDIFIKTDTGEEDINDIVLKIQNAKDQINMAQNIVLQQAEKEYIISINIENIKASADLAIAKIELDSKDLYRITSEAKQALLIAAEAMQELTSAIENSATEPSALEPSIVETNIIN